MTDIADIQLKIKAVEFALASFSRYRNKEQERVAYLDSQLDTVQFLDVYADFTKDELKDEKKQLQDEKKQLQEKENLLLAQQQGIISVRRGESGAYAYGFDECLYSGSSGKRSREDGNSDSDTERSSHRRKRSREYSIICTPDILSKLKLLVIFRFVDDTRGVFHRSQRRAIHRDSG